VLAFRFRFNDYFNSLFLEPFSVEMRSLPMGLKYILFLCLLVTSKSLGESLKGNTFVSGQKFALVYPSCPVTVHLQ
jgi:hypothetical protein